jgi:outer membrane protein insertion porin family
VAEGYTLVAALSKDIYTDLNGRLGYAYTQSRSTRISADIQTLEPEGSVATGGLFTRFVLDKRDNWLWPKRGSVNEVSAESNLKLLGGDLDYNKLEARSYWYLPLSEDGPFVLAFGARAGVIVRGQSTDLIPIQYRFFNGGYDSVRSFRYNELGPKVNGDPTGGEFYSTGNVEIRMPGFILDDLGWTVFWDVGNVIFRREDIGFKNYSHGLGAGVRYDLPIGPIRLDWGWNPNPKEDERDWALHLSVGFAF